MSANLDRAVRVSTAVITGSSQGLGKALAAAFLHRGHNVVVGSRDPAADAAAARDLAARGSGRVIAQSCDVGEQAEVQRLWDAAVRAFGRVDIWINNAGLARGSLPIAAQPASVMAEMLRTNVLGTVNGCQVALAGMRAQGGAIYNLAGAGSDGTYVPGMIGYATTKAAVSAFTRWLAQEVAGQGVLVGSLSPGLVITEGFLREHAAVPAVHRAAREAYVNLIADHVETVADWFVARMLANRRNGAEFVWLTPAKLRWRKFVTRFRPRDVLARYRDADGCLRPVTEPPR
jgi:NAD(P)-dependent dehydrogenase (short-subunit alcohol dehydrogenase family)